MMSGAGQQEYQRYFLMNPYSRRFRGVFTSVKDLRNEIHRFIKQHNARSAKPFTWTKNANVILEKVQNIKKLHDTTNQSGH